MRDVLPVRPPTDNGRGHDPGRAGSPAWCGRAELRAHGWAAGAAEAGAIQPPAPASAAPDGGALRQPVRDRGLTINDRNENIAADIPPDLTAADDILSRYGKWATSGGRSAATSVLGRLYIREADPKESLEAYIRRRSQVPSSGGMSVAEALAAQRALARVPELERTVLVILYVPHRIPTAVRLRIAKIPPRVSRERHLHGLRMFNNLHKQVMAELP